MPAFGPVGTKVGALCAKMGGTAEAIFTAFVPFYTGQRLFFYLIGGWRMLPFCFFYQCWRFAPVSFQLLGNSYIACQYKNCIKIRKNNR